MDPSCDCHSPAPVWPWMKDAKCRLDNPIAPLDEHDKRPAVKDLIAKHRSELDRLKASVGTHPLYVGSKHDDLWLLRFLLSQRKHDKALEAAKSTLEFRRDHLLDDRDIRGIRVDSSVLLNDTDGSLPLCATAAGKMLSCYDNDETLLYSIPDPQRGMIGFLQFASRNQHKMAARLDEADYFQAHLFFTEFKFQWMDFLTRTTGRLTKYCSIADLHGTHPKMVHQGSKKLDSAAARQMEDKYPQLLGSMLVCFAPKWSQAVFSLLKPFLPKRLLAKVDMIKPKSKKKDLIKLLEYCSIDHLPERYGGKWEGWPPPTVSRATLPSLLGE